MIDTSTLPNWQRWHAKEQSGVNRGYAQAYLNTSRADHFVCITSRNSDYDEKYTVFVKCGTSGNWKSGGTTEAKFEGQESNSEMLLSQAEDTAREWMRDHPCERDGAPDAVELLTDILNKFREHNLVPQHDMSLKGISKPGHSDSTSHDVRLFDSDKETKELHGVDTVSDADVLLFGLGVDGKASGLSFREYTERSSDGESKQVHEPTNQSKLHSAIESAFESVGFESITVKNGGHQRYWDYTTRYTVYTFIPDDLTLDLDSPQTHRGNSFF